RLAGGGLAGAILAAAGLGDRPRRALAQQAHAHPRCDELHAQCLAASVEACGPRPPYSGSPEFAVWFACSAEQGDCIHAQRVCPTHCTAGEGACSGCSGDGGGDGGICIALVNPEGHLLCRCVTL
ncbi:MAG: hypothetical protein AVDCRST_MAG19-1424, partial [uncultured Thermomicrobiales bacterium]